MLGKAASFDLCGGHPALDFVNSLDNRFNSRGCTEGLRSYDDLLRFAEQTRLLDAAQAAQLTRAVAPGAAARALHAARALREALAAIFYALLDARPPPAADLRTLEQYLRAADRQRELCWRAEGRERPALAWVWRNHGGKAELPVWVVAQAALDLISSPDMQRVRGCEADTCRWLFLDTSKNHTRRWCKMQVCGNRMKARRYQARHSG